MSVDFFPYLPMIREWIFVSILVFIFWYDLKYMLILDRVTIPAMLVAVMINLGVGTISISSMVLGALLVGGFFYAQFSLSKGTWIGGGDIRLGVLMGLMLGVQQALLATFLAYVLGATISICLLVLKRVNRKTQIPLGTFLSLSTIITLFWGHTILSWYLGFFH